MSEGLGLLVDDATRVESPIECGRSALPCPPWLPIDMGETDGSALAG